MDDEVSELRLVVTAPDYDAALAFYRDTLGLPEQAAFSSPDGRVTILAAGRATLELTDPGNAAFIDDVEVGRRVAGQIRVAFEVSDTAAMTDRLARAGAHVVAPPTRTPWSTVNSRLDGPGGLHLTLFGDPPGEPARRSEDEIMVGRVGAPDRIDAPVLLVEADPSWPAVAASLIADIDSVLGDDVLLLEHAGSTSVPELAAKPVIDLVLALRDTTDEAAYVGALERLGYQLKVRSRSSTSTGCSSSPSRQSTCTCSASAPREIDRMLAFRDHLRADAGRPGALRAHQARPGPADLGVRAAVRRRQGSAVVEQIVARAERRRDRARSLGSATSSAPRTPARQAGRARRAARAAVPRGLDGGPRLRRPTGSPAAGVRPRRRWRARWPLRRRRRCSSAAGTATRSAPACPAG